MTALLGEIILHNFFLNLIACYRYPDKHNQLLKEDITRASAFTVCDLLQGNLW